MSEKQKSLKTISIIECIFGLVYCVEGLIVTSNKAAYFISAACTIITAVFCYLAANDASKAKVAKILLWITIILSLVGCVISFLNRASALDIGTAVVDICIAAYLLKLIKEIHG